MRRVIYNLGSIRPPLTGIGRYAWELVKGGLDAGKSLSAYINGQLLEGDNLTAVLLAKEMENSDAGRNVRSAVAHIPFSRSLYRNRQVRHFSNSISNEIAEGALYHNLNYAAASFPGSEVSTVYDLSHILSDSTHPRHRVRFLKRYISALAQRSEPIITISQSVKREICQHYPIDPQRIYVTSLAAGSEFQPRNAQQCASILAMHGLQYQSYVLCVGTLEPRKNLSTVLDAYQTMDPGLQAANPLVVVGAPGWNSKKLEHRLKKLQKRSLVKRLGYIPQAHLPILYSGAAAFVYPSLYEGFGLPLLEAMQSGCPCITSNDGALAEVSADAAICIDPRAAEQLATELSGLLQSTEQHNHYSTLAIKRAADFSWAKTVQQSWQVYDCV